MNIVGIPAFSDNYIWAIVGNSSAAIIDPGDAMPVERFLEQQQLTLSYILLTHHHSDHVGGVAQLKALYPDLIVYGPAHSSIKGIDHALQDQDTFTINIDGEIDFRTFSVPGHTLDHIAYFSPGYLFPGDTLFSAGCGRLFEGTPEQMLASLTKLAALPQDTLIYCAHEYTEANLCFAEAVEGSNTRTVAHHHLVSSLRKNHQPTLPTRLSLELAINPFLRIHVPAVIEAVKEITLDLPEQADKTQIFGALRHWKDNFRP